MRATVLITAEGSLCLLLHTGQAFQMRMLPYVDIVVLVKPFHESVAGWMIEWRKDQLRPHVRRQAQGFAQDATVREASTEAALVVHLSFLRAEASP